MLMDPAQSQLTLSDTNVQFLFLSLREYHTTSTYEKALDLE